MVTAHPLSAQRVLKVVDELPPDPSTAGRDNMNYLAPAGGGSAAKFEVVAGMLEELPSEACQGLSDEERERLDQMRRELRAALNAWHRGEQISLGKSGLYGVLFVAKLRELLRTAATYRTERQRYLLDKLERYILALREIQKEPWGSVRERVHRQNGQIAEWLAKELWKQLAESFSKALGNAPDLDAGARFLEGLAAEVRSEPERFELPAIDLETVLAEHGIEVAEGWAFVPAAQGSGGPLPGPEPPMAQAPAPEPQATPGESSPVTESSAPRRVWRGVLLLAVGVAAGVALERSGWILRLLSVATLLQIAFLVTVGGYGIEIMGEEKSRHGFLGALLRPHFWLGFAMSFCCALAGAWLANPSAK